jgi:hypothetical protein
LVIGRETKVSTVFCSDSAGVVLTVYCTGRRMRSVLPILAPALANESSYCRLTALMFALGRYPQDRSFELLHVTMQSRPYHHPCIMRGALRFGPLGPTPSRDGRCTLPD